ncbi:GTPase-associated system all-helical protein GASH [Pseudomonas sp. P105]|uniref:GTPase-associated system all-helical protein GASH n=1 Tax=Pseudomonas sp. P105 TaxID=3049542 RepID=UPI002934FF6C|nr:GTPase-associated system all-helical protein GASH [Pseudomonas sp. P105]WNZ79316.1 GTPase-associated system all-helical protein GASH [Pseudomonas sp. P105]
MNEDVLVRFLSVGLIDVGGDDTKLEKLQATAVDLAALLKKTPSKAAAYALIAFDPQAPVDDPVVLETLEALRKRWATYVNTFSGTPIAVVRAILLDALTRAASEDERIGVAFVNSARNALPFMQTGDEQQVWIDVVVAIEKRVDVRAEAEWATPSSITVQAMSLDFPELPAPKITTARVNRENFKKAMRATAGPHYHDPQQGNVATGGNPHWLHQSPQNWVTEFGDRSSSAVADMIDAVASKTAVEQADLSAPFHALVASVTEYVGSALTAMSTATTGLQRRTNLLWWKEALFSPSARVSYRALTPAAAAAQMAFDLHQQVPTFSPASVSAFLFEAVLLLPSVDQDRRFSIYDLVSEAQSDGSLATLRSAGSDLIAPPIGRGPVMALIAHPGFLNAQAESEFQRLTGIPGDAQVTLPEWATWIFREMQAARAATDGVKTPRRQRKA